MPPLALPGREFMENARAIWEELGLPPITPQPPWHGYSLGDWDERYDVYARRAVDGALGRQRRETIARRRGGADTGNAGARRRRRQRKNPDCSDETLIVHGVKK